MSKFLTKSAWETAAKKHDLEDKALSKALESFGKCRDDDKAGREKALKEILEIAGELKKETKFKALASYLKEVLSDAQEELDELEQAEEEGEEAAQYEKEFGQQLKLALERVKNLAPEEGTLETGEAKPQLKYVAYLAGSSCAVVVSKKVGGATRKLVANRAGGSGGRYLSGACIFEERAHTFIVEQVAGGLAKKFSRALADATGHKYKVRIRGLNGEVLDDENDNDPGQEGEKKEEIPQLTKGEIVNRLKELKLDIDKAIEGKAPTGPLANKAFIDTANFVKEEKLRESSVSLVELEKLVKQALVELSLTGPTDEQKWNAVAEKIRLEVEEGLKAGKGDIDKIRMVWAFALGKVEGGSYDAALKSLTPLQKLLSEAKNATTTTAEKEIPTGKVSGSTILSELKGLATQLKEGLVWLPGRATEVKNLASGVNSDVTGNDLEGARGKLEQLRQFITQAKLVSDAATEVNDAYNRFTTRTNPLRTIPPKAVGFASLVQTFMPLIKGIETEKNKPDWLAAKNALGPCEIALTNLENFVREWNADKLRYENAQKDIQTDYDKCFRIGGFNDQIANLAQLFRDADAGIKVELNRISYKNAADGHPTLATKVSDLVRAKTKYDEDKQKWETNYANGLATIERVEGCGSISTALDNLKLPFTNAMATARTAAKERRFGDAVPALATALEKARLYLEAKRVLDEQKALEFNNARQEGARLVTGVKPLAGVKGTSVEDVERAMEGNKDLEKSKGLQALLKEAKEIEGLHATARGEALQGEVGKIDGVLQAARAAILHAQEFQREHKADSRSKTDQAKFSEAQKLIGRYNSIIVSLEGLQANFNDINRLLAGDAKSIAKGMGYLQAMSALVNPAELANAAREMLRRTSQSLLKGAKDPEEMREISELIGGEFKNSYDRQMTAGPLLGTAKGSTKLRDHSSTKIQDSKRCENVDQAKLLSQRLVNARGELELTALFTAKPEDLAGDSPASRQMARVLKNLRDDPEALLALENIPAPDPKSGGAKMIRATLGLAKDAPVGVAEARQAALSALLTDLRQQDVGSCFATQTAIQVHDKKPSGFLKDIGELMRTGALVRSHNGNTIRMPLETLQSDGALETSTVKLSKGVNPSLKGSSNSSAPLAPNTKLEDSPSFKAVFDQLGIVADRGTVMNTAIANMQASDEFKISQNRKALRAAVGRIQDAELRKQVLAAAQPQITADPASVKNALNLAMTNAGVPSTQETNARNSFDGVLNATDFDIEPGVLVRQLMMDKAGITGETLKKVQEVSQAKSAQLKMDPRMSEVNERGELVPPKDQDLKQLIADVEKLQKDIQWADLQKYEESKQSGYDAYLGDQDNRLLRAWEYTLSSLGEASDKERRNFALHTATDETISEEILLVQGRVSDDPRFKKKVKSSELAKDSKAIVTEYQKLYKEIVTSGYDASLDTGTVSTDGNSSRGGFYLYDSQGQTDPSKWVKIDDKGKYQTLVRGLVMLAWTNLFASLKDGNRREVTRELADRLADSLGSDGFVAEVRKKVKTQTKVEIDEPWKVHRGSHAGELIPFYEQREITVEPLGTPGNSEELMKALGGQLRKLWTDPSTNLKTDAESDPETGGISSSNYGVHTFLLTPGDPKLKKMLNTTGKSMDTCINEFKVAEKKKWNDACTGTPLPNPPDVAVRSYLVSLLGRKGSNGDFTATLQEVKRLGGTGTLTYDHLTKAGKHLLKTSYNGQTDEIADQKTARAIFCSVVPPIPTAELEGKLEKLAKALNVPTDLAPAVIKRAKAALAKLDPNKANMTALREQMEAAMKLEGLVDSAVPIEKVSAALLDQAGIIFADSNWGDAEHHIKYAMVVNPMNGEMQMWQMNEDGSNPFRLEDDEWVKKPWVTMV